MGPDASIYEQSMNTYKYAENNTEIMIYTLDCIKMIRKTIDDPYRINLTYITSLIAPQLTFKYLHVNLYNGSK